MQYCKKCVIPGTRPAISFDAVGICSACRMAEKKFDHIDWGARLIKFKEILSRHRRSVEYEYDCIVPVSGGKDSIYQAYTLKNEFDMNPLCITWRTLARTKRGEENLYALRNIGVDHIDFTPNPSGTNKITKLGFERFGDCSLIDHLAIYNVIPKFSLKFNIPLVVWGENPYMEYGGNHDVSGQDRQSTKLVREHDILKGFETKDWISESITRRELNAYITPDDSDLDAIGYEPIYLGYYIPWDSKHNGDVAIKQGFKPREAGPIMGLYNFSDLDCKNIVIHHYFKWLKFGFNRVTDNASNEIRKGRLSREEAIELIKKFDGMKPPIEYINAFCKQINISFEYFWEVAEKFRNLDIWKKDKNGEWYINGWIGGDMVPDRFPHTQLTDHETAYEK